jgi:hypothetical protein
MEQPGWIACETAVSSAGYPEIDRRAAGWLRPAVPLVDERLISEGK